MFPFRDFLSFLVFVEKIINNNHHNYYLYMDFDFDFSKQETRFYKYCKYKSIRSMNEYVSANEYVDSELKHNIRYFWKDGSATEIIEKINDLFVLYIKPNGIFFLKNHIDPTRYNHLISRRIGTIACYLLISKDSKIHYIDYCNTTISNLNLLEYTINFYQSHYKKCKYLIPQSIILSSCCYWKLFFMRNYGFDTENDIINFVNKNNLNVVWSYLYHAYSEN